MTSSPFRDSKVIFICPLWTFLCKCWCVSGLHVYCQCVMQCGTPTGPGLTRPRRSALGCGLSRFMWSGMMLQFILRGLDCLSQNLKQSIYMLFRYFSQNQRGAEISWQTDRVILLQAWNVKDSPVLTFTDLFLCCVLMIIDWVSFGFRQTRLLRVCCSHHIVTIFWYFIKDQSIMAENFRY